MQKRITLRDWIFILFDEAKEKGTKPNVESYITAFGRDKIAQFYREWKEEIGSIGHNPEARRALDYRRQYRSDLSRVQAGPSTTQASDATNQSAKPFSAAEARAEREE